MNAWNLDQSLKAFNSIELFGLEIEACCCDRESRAVVHHAVATAQRTISWFELSDALGSVALAAENSLLDLLAATGELTLRDAVLRAASAVLCRRFAVNRLDDTTRRRQIELSEVIVLSMEKLIGAKYAYRNAVRFRKYVSNAVVWSIADLWRQNRPYDSIDAVHEDISIVDVADRVIVTILGDEQRHRLEKAVIDAKSRIVPSKCSAFGWYCFVGHYVHSKQLALIAREYKAKTGQSVSVATIHNKAKEVLVLLSVDINERLEFTVSSVVALLEENDKVSILNADAMCHILCDAGLITGHPLRKRGRPRKSDH